MSSDLRLVVFDVDGTLVDSQAGIIAAMTHAFEMVSAPVPDRGGILGIVGLSLEVAIPRLAPALDAATHARMVQGYKDAYVELRQRKGAADSSPLYPGAREVLDTLSACENILLGVATGKSRRGLDKLLDGHQLRGVFITEQVADFHPSKPHPAMLHEALRDCGLGAEQAMMIGDTSFDMEMAQAAGVTGIGVSWGYHPKTQLGQARIIIDDFAELPAVLNQIWG